MASQNPFAQLTGVLKVYLAPTGETVPVVNATPGGNWVEMGSTDGEQAIEHRGKLTYFRDNDHQAPVKSIRPEEDVLAKFKLVSLTLEHYGRILDTVSDVISATGPPATKKLPLKRGRIPTEYALLFKGEAASPYGAFPGQYVLPRCVEDSEPVATFSKNSRAALDCSFTVLEDDNQADADKMGWLIVQTA